MGIDEPTAPACDAPAVATGAEAALPSEAELATVGVAAGLEAAAATGAPVASSGGTFSTAPSFKRLSLSFVKAAGLASKMAFDARLNTARSCDCVMAIAISLSDCPGLTVTVVAADPACMPETAAPAEAVDGAAVCTPPGCAAIAAGDTPAPASAAEARASATARLCARTVQSTTRSAKAWNVELEVMKLSCAPKTRP
jgi:hypothetical protein